MTIAPPPRHDLPIRSSAVTVMTIACAITVSNIYFPQPLLDTIARSLQVSNQSAGSIVGIGQIGYALGLLLVVPLGDATKMRRLAVVLPALTSVGLVVAAVAPTVPTLAVATLALSTTTVLPQVIVPAAASLAAPQTRGRIVGKLSLGLTLGVVLSRTISGMLSDLSGSWRTAYVVAAVLTGAVAVVLPRYLPEHAGPQRSSIPYRTLLASLPGLLGAHRDMRLSALLGGTVFAVYAAFWATATFHLAGPPFRLGPTYAGILGLVSLPGSLLAVYTGRLCDQFGSTVVNVLSLVVSALALVVLSMTSLTALVTGSNLLGFGVACGAIANQARIFRLGTEIRARLNTIYMVSSFAGGALGSLLGTAVYIRSGWTAMVLVSLGFLSIPALVLAAPIKRLSAIARSSRAAELRLPPGPVSR